MRVLPALLLLSAAGLPARADVDDAVLQAEAARIAVVAKAREAAVAVFAPGGQGGGSGVVITPDGYALSNFHVTRGAGDAMKCGMADGRMYDAVIVGIDPVGDVALIKLLGRDDFPFAEMADSDQVRVGDEAFAVGNPFLLATDFTPSVSYGIVSGVHRYQYPAGTLLEYTDCIQTDASINPGNSGGPLFDGQGRVIGINGRGSFEKRGRVNVGVGYAISINQIKNFMGHLRAGRIVDHATLGARVASQEDGRVTVVDILEDCDAYRRGLRRGDEIVRFGGRPIQTVNAFKNVLGIFPKDWRVMLTYRREGETFTVPVRLEGLHSAEELISKVQGRAAPQREPAPEQPMPENPMPDEPMPDEPAPEGEQPEQPMPGRPERQRPGGPRPGGQRPGGPRPQTPAVARRAPMPKEVQEVFEARRGYANFHFNRTEMARTWNQFTAHGDFRELTGDWVLGGEMEGGGEALLRINDALAECTLPGGHLELPIEESLVDATDPPGSGGMLAALYLWRRLLTTTPEKFGDIQYLGTVPVLGHPSLAAAAFGGRPPLCDALVATYAGVECRYLFDSRTGQLVLLEMFRGIDDDPCELYFSDYVETDGRMVPHRIEVRYGDGVYAAFKLSSVTLSKPVEP